MGALGIEVLQKLRSAVKAKVVELKSGYVGEELPEYVMILIVNKKDRREMEAALNLFLGIKTGPFVHWLQDVLQKLEEVTLPQNKNTDNNITSITDIIRTGLITKVKNDLRVGPAVKTETIEIDDNEDDVQVVESEITREQIEELQKKIDKAKQKLLDDDEKEKQKTPKATKKGKTVVEKITKRVVKVGKDGQKKIIKRRVRIKKEPGSQDDKDKEKSKSKSIKKKNKDSDATKSKPSTVIKLSEVLRAENEALRPTVRPTVKKSVPVMSEFEKRKAKMMKREAEKIKAHMMDVQRRFRPADQFGIRREMPFRHRSPRYRRSFSPRHRRSYSPRHKRSPSPHRRRHRSSSRSKRVHSRSPRPNHNRRSRSHETVKKLSHHHHRSRSRSPRTNHRTHHESPTRIRRTQSPNLSLPNNNQNNIYASPSRRSESPLIQTSTRNSASPTKTSIGARLLALSQTPQDEKTKEKLRKQSSNLTTDDDKQSQTLTSLEAKRHSIEPRKQSIERKPHSPELKKRHRVSSERLKPVELKRASPKRSSSKRSSPSRTKSRESKRESEEPRRQRDQRDKSSHKSIRSQPASKLSSSSSSISQSSRRTRPTMRARMDDEELKRRRRIAEAKARKAKEDASRTKLHSQVVTKRAKPISLAFIEKLIEEEERQNELERREKEARDREAREREREQRERQREKQRVELEEPQVTKFDISKLKEKIIIEVPNDLMVPISNDQLTDVIDLNCDDEIISLDDDEPISSLQTPDRRSPTPPEKIETVNNVKATVASTAPKVPQFIVTLSGVSKRLRENPKFVRDKPSPTAQTTTVAESITPSTTESSSQNESTEPRDKTKFDSSSLNEDSSTQTSSSTFHRRKISPIRFDLTDNESSGDENHRKDDSKTKEKPTMDDEPKIVPLNPVIQATPGDLASRLGPAVKPTNEPLVIFKSKERCKFFPNCSSVPCEFHHPSIPCAAFPHCAFGAHNCNFLHPPCKFDVLCTKPGCNFLHTVPVTSAPKKLPRPVVTSSLVMCKFHPNCMNPVCHFYHPKPCKFGKFCVNKLDCAFYHEDIPAKDSLTWMAT